VRMSVARGRGEGAQWGAGGYGRGKEREGLYGVVRREGERGPWKAEDKRRGAACSKRRMRCDGVYRKYGGSAEGVPTPHHRLLSVRIRACCDRRAGGQVSGTDDRPKLSMSRCIHRCWHRICLREEDVRKE
jgi:hypothetical protein